MHSKSIKDPTFSQSFDNIASYTTILEMEDGVEEIQNIVFGDKGIRFAGSSDEEAEQREEEKRKEETSNKEGCDHKERPSGLINNFISSLVVPGGGGEEVYEDKRGELMIGDTRKLEEDNKEGVLINHLISVSNLTSPRGCEGQERNADEFELEVKEEDRGGERLSTSEEESGGGVISSLISNIFHQGHQGGGGKEEKVKDVVDEETEHGGGSLVDSLISKLPTPLAAEDAAPATDEASILIHSIVHD